eukprot:3871099-Rhodomonas_salina.4
MAWRSSGRWERLKEDTQASGPSCEEEERIVRGKRGEERDRRRGGGGERGEEGCERGQESG